MDFDHLLTQYKWPLGIGLTGLILVGVASLWFSATRPSPNTVEIISEEESEEEKTIIVDLEGAVQNPGIYELPQGARINDLLIRAGGLSAKADREWLTKNINLAQKLSDGTKLYFPSVGDVQNSGQVAGAGSTTAINTSQTATKININTATAGQLDTLWGIGEIRAEAIIAQRPYGSLEELMIKAKIPKNVYERIKDQISLY